jgi:hypothetical protein
MGLGMAAMMPEGALLRNSRQEKNSRRWSKVKDQQRHTPPNSIGIGWELRRLELLRRQVIECPNGINSLFPPTVA